MSNTVIIKEINYYILIINVIPVNDKEFFREKIVSINVD